MAFDHYISQFLTRPWEQGNRQLRYFDLTTNKFGLKKTKKLLGMRRVNTPDTEQFLSKYVETPCATFQDRLIAATSAEDADRVFNETAPFTAFSAMYWYQAARLKDVHGRLGGEEVDEPSRMDQLAARGPAWLDQFAAAMAQRYQAVLICKPAKEVFYFPDTAFLVIPIIGRPPVLAIPFTPAFLLAFVDRSLPHADLAMEINREGFLSTASFGTSPVQRYVIIPPHVEDPSVETVHNCRAQARTHLQIYGEMSAIAGLPAWVPTR